jgi:hypothetical protein
MKDTITAALVGAGLFVALWLVALALLPAWLTFPAGGFSLVLSMLVAESVRDSLE